MKCAHCGLPTERYVRQLSYVQVLAEMSKFNVIAILTESRFGRRRYEKYTSRFCDATRRTMISAEIANG